MQLVVRAARATLTALALSLTLGCSASSATKPLSGLTGRVLIGPTCPVQHAGERCERPYQAQIVVFRPRGHRLVKTFRSGRNGRFRVTLAPGRYVLTAAKAGLPRLAPLSATVRPARFTKLMLVFDTGIR